jgi:hypothetical protein
MNTDHARALLNPLVAFCIKSGTGFLGQHRRGNLRYLAPICALLLPIVVQSTATAKSQISPVEGSASIIGGRNVAGSQGAKYLLPGGIQVILSPNSEATLATQPQMLALTSGKRTPTYSVFLSAGRVDVDIPNGSSGAVAVAGPADVRVIVRQGQVSTLASGNSVYALSTKHPLLVSQKDRLSTLAPGLIRQFSRNAPPTDRPALGPPKWLAGRRVWLAIPDSAQVSNFAWSPVQGASRYAIELRRVSDGHVLGEFSESSTKIGQSLPPLTAGNYQLAVRAVDELGLPGLASEPLRVQVVGVAIPPGAKLQPDSRIEISQTQTIQLNNADGLSLTRAQEGTQLPASEPIGILNGKPTPIMIQGEDPAAPCLMWLLPSKTPVSAHVGPKWVIWPHESVDLEIRWSDALGRRLAPDVEPVVSVLVGIEPVDVVWEKQATHWHARLAPQPGHGPWVVRLEVHDQLGGLLARDFVEVEQRPKHRALAASASLAELTQAR